MPQFPKPGIVRLTGKKMEALRVACYLRDEGRCTKCGRRVALTELDAEWNMPVMHLAHIRNKRNHGDVISNVRVRCPSCHLVEDHNKKSVPPKNGDTQCPS